MPEIIPSIRGIDLFCGAGGLSLGAQLAGIRVEFAVEENHSSAQTFKANHPNTHLIVDDIRTVHLPKLPKSSKWILFGGPPCQGFSTSNQRTRSSANPKNWLFDEFLNFARLHKPHCIVLENVLGLRTTENGQFERLITAKIRQLGYSLCIWALCSSDYGVPQKRKRLFFVGFKNGKTPCAPPITVMKPQTVRDAIADLPILVCGACVDELSYGDRTPSSYAKQLRNKNGRCTGHLVTLNNSLVQKRYPHIPQGGNWLDIPAHLMKNYTNLNSKKSRHTGIYRRLLWDEPSVVIANFRKNMLVHPEQNRGLSVREAARIQSFPDSYEFRGSIGMQQQQISNAVPPLLAASVFNQILKLI